MQTVLYNTRLGFLHGSVSWCLSWCCLQDHSLVTAPRCNASCCYNSVNENEVCNMYDVKAVTINFFDNVIYVNESTKVQSLGTV